MTCPNTDRLLNNLRIRLPGAIDDAIKIELFNTLNDFLQNSNIWRQDVDIDVTPEEQEYQITLNATGDVVRLMGVVDNNGYPVAAAMDLPGVITLYTAPQAPATYSAQVVLTVTDPTKTDGVPVFPGWIANKYMNDIIDGVLSRMMSQVAKPYSNPTLALYHARQFNAAIANARQEYNRRNVYRGQRWSFPQTFNRNKTRR